MKKQLFLAYIFSFLVFSNTFSQDFLGLSTGNYAGITGVSLQPASIVDSRHKFDINLFSTDVDFNNNYFLIDKDALLKFNKNNFDSYGAFKDNYLSEASLPAGDKAFFNVRNRVQLPLSFMATTGKKSAIALNLQFRTMMQGRGISTDLAHLGFNDFYFQPLNNTSIDASGISINSLSWAEVGLTIGRVLYSSGNHFLKGAITGKYLAGLSSFYIASNDLSLQVNGDSTFNFNSPNVTYKHNKNADFNKLFNRNFEPDANSFGLDAGLVYEYRGNVDKFKYIKNDDEESYLEDRRDVNKYIFKLGVSLLDVGMLQFNKPANVNSFSANIDSWDLKNTSYDNLKQFDTALASMVTPSPNDANTYNVYLPTALSAQLDVKFVKGLFLNVMSYWPVKIGSANGLRFHNYGFYAITPRYERRHFGIYFPYFISERNDFTDYKKNTLGVTLRLGPLFFGSSNLPSMLFKNNLRGADVHVGLKVGFTYGKPNKSTSIMNRILKEDETAVVNPSKVSLSNPSDTVINTNVPEKNDISAREKATTNAADKSGKLIMNYKSGEVYDNPNAKDNIIIVNNYYYSSDSKRPDSVMVQSLPNYNADSLYGQRIKMAQQQMQLREDSIRRATADSLSIKRKQLDTLIRSMQQLQRQMEMDSSYIRDRSMNVSPVQKDAGIENDSVRNLSAQENIADTIHGNDVYNISEPDTSQAFDLKKKEVATDTSTRYDNSDTYNPSQQQPRRSEVQLANSQSDTLAANLRLMRQRQDELYKQYAQQSERLTNDINRLNERMVNPRQYDYEHYQPPSPTYNTYVPNRQYVPYNTPYVPSASQPYRGDNTRINELASSAGKTDTVYIRDTVTDASVDTVTQVVVYEKSLVNKPAVSDAGNASPVSYIDLPAEIILFDLGKWTVTPIYHRRLDFVADILEKNPRLGVSITGHTDPSGSKKTNEWLSFKRAQTVADYLKTQGVGEYQVWIKSLASGDPAVKGDTRVANSQNRRVEVKIVNK